MCTTLEIDANIRDLIMREQRASNRHGITIKTCASSVVHHIHCAFSMNLKVSLDLFPVLIPDSLPMMCLLPRTTTHSALVSRVRSRDTVLFLQQQAVPWFNNGGGELAP